MGRWRSLLLLLLPLVLSGCMLSVSAEDLYALPALPGEYEALSAALTELISAGAEYAAPQSGSNLPPVQMVDLDGDGNDEVIVFLRVSSEERPLRIYIFEVTESTCEKVSSIEGSGSSIQSILYSDLNGDGIQEIIVSWAVSAEVQAVAVYALEDLEPVRLMSSAYARYEIVDLDGDGNRELVVLRGDELESGGAIADYYDWDEGNNALSLRSTARLSTSVAALQWTQVGALRGGEAAVFVTGRDTDSRAVTDILVCRQPDLVNLVLNRDTGVSSLIDRFVNLQPADINGDGATEVPQPAALLPDGEEEYWEIYWHSYDLEGTEQLEAITYHNQADNWYLLIPERWDGHFAVRQVNSSSSVHSTTFYRLQGKNGLGDELFTIYTLTGANRENLANATGRSILRRRAETVYAISFGGNYGRWGYAITADEIADRFIPIVKRWNVGSN